MTHDWLFEPSTVTLANAVAVPEIVGESVAVPPVAGLTIAMVGGAMAVTLTVAVLLTPPTLEATADNVCGPTGTVTEHDQVPAAVAVVEQSCPSGPLTVTDAPGVAVPDTVGESDVCVFASGLLMATVGGATVVNVMGCEATPQGVLAVTVSALGPAGSVANGPQVYVPAAVAVVLQIVAPVGSVMLINAPGVAVPAMVGVVVVETLTGEVTVRLGGAMAVKLLMAVFDKPPVLLAMAVTEAGPAVNVRLEQA